jgi:ribosome-associated toxin RatA of RatAB toxin-antitoxin module
MRLSLLCAAALGLIVTSGCAAQTEMLSASAPARATTHADIPADADAAREAKRYRLPTPGSDIDTGCALIAVDAPIERVLEVVLSYGEYHNILPRLQDSRVMSKTDEATEVYMRAPVLDGTITIWGVMRFAPPKPFGDGGKKITGNMIKGNLKAWRGAWKLTPLGKSRTALRMELYADVDLPVPDSWITPELLSSADKSVTAVRDLAEKPRE